jgi:hypothetical protein
MLLNIMHTPHTSNVGALRWKINAPITTRELEELTID